MVKQNVVVLLSILLTIASLLFASNSFSIFGLQDIGTVNIRGDVRCSLNGDPNAPPIPGAPVRLVCNGSNTTIAETVTNPDGTFTIVLSTLQAALFTGGSCYVLLDLPFGTCGAAPPDGTLTASLNLVSIIVSGLAVIANYTTGPFLDTTV